MAGGHLPVYDSPCKKDCFNTEYDSRTFFCIKLLQLRVWKVLKCSHCKSGVTNA